jgi:hypothetical protein
MGEKSGGGGRETKDKRNRTQTNTRKRERKEGENEGGKTTEGKKTGREGNRLECERVTTPHGV